MDQRIGKQTVKFENPVSILETASIGGKKEGEGPLKAYFDQVLKDDYWGEDSWEKAEIKLQREVANMALAKAKLTAQDISYVFAGDLMNQCVSSHYAMRELGIPFFGLYGACSTMVESMTLGAMLIGGGFSEKSMCLTSSHFCSAEKQFRFPLEYGGQRTPSAQWTVTGAGCAILTGDGSGPFITHATTGKIIDMGVSDLNNMGGAMAPAAVDTLTAHFEDTGFSPSDYDLILTGDLGVIGSDILTDLMNQKGYNIYPNHNDCGKMIFDIKEQDVHAGGSGCGCCGSVFCGNIYKELKKGTYKRILVMATGALMNTITIQQGESIPAIAHALTITTEL